MLQEIIFGWNYAFLVITQHFCSKKKKENKLRI